MEKNLVSIVVPVYNVEKYLQKCIDSILLQTYKTIEILLIDDGSTDSSGEICDKAMQLDNRIQVIHKENGGLSDARNVGISKAKGEYITFIDSDDYISNRFIEILFHGIKKEADIAACAFLSVTENYENTMTVDLKAEMKFLQWSSEEALHFMLLQKYITTSAWGKLYRTSLFENIEYPKGKLYEDLATTYKLLDIANKIVFIDIPMYYYVQRNNSIQHSSFSERNLDEYEHIMQVKNFVDTKYPTLKVEVKNRLVSSCFHMMFLMKNKNDYKEVYGKLKKIICKYRKQILFKRNVSTKVRCGCFMSYFGFTITRKMYEMFNMRGKDI